MKINNLKRASAVVLASLNAGTVFAQNLNVPSKTTVTHNHSNFKKQGQAKKTGLIDLPQIATILGIGGLLFVGADELVVRPIINKFSRKSGPNPSGEEACEKENKNLSVFRDEKDIINSVFDNMKKYGNNKEVNDCLEVLRNFGLKLCDCNFDSAKSVTVEKLYNVQNTGLKELLDVIVKNSNTSSIYSKQFQNTESLLNDIKFDYNNGEITVNEKNISINKDFASISIISDICYQIFCAVDDCVAKDIFHAVYTSFCGAPKNMCQAHVRLNMETDAKRDIDTLHNLFLSVDKGITWRQFFTDEKYAGARNQLYIFMDKYGEKVDNDIKAWCSGNMSSGMRDDCKSREIKDLYNWIYGESSFIEEFKDKYKPIDRSVRAYLKQKLRELIPEEEN